MRKKSDVFIIVLLVIAIVLSITSIVLSFIKAKSSETKSSDVQYVMYLGTNDKDTNEPVFDRETSMEKAKEVLISHFGGYTIQEAEGGWSDGQTVFQEYTLIIYLSDTKLEQVHLAADELVKLFHQSSVLIQTNPTTTEFYAGKAA